MLRCIRARLRAPARSPSYQVEMIVHSKQRRRFRRETLLGWLGESVHPEIEHLESKPIRPGSNKPFTSHETVKPLYAETTRDEPLNGKRYLKIYLASGEDVADKAGRPRGSTKAARAAAEVSIGRGRDVGPAGRGGSALASSSIAGRCTQGGRGHGAGGGGAGAGGSLVAAPAGSSAPDDGGSYDASSSAGASVGRGRDAGPASASRSSCSPSLPPPPPSSPP